MGDDDPVYLVVNGVDYGVTISEQFQAALQKAIARGLVRPVQHYEVTDAGYVFLKENGGGDRRPPQAQGTEDI